MSTGDCRKISREEVQKVQNLIEQCLSHYTNKKQVIDILHREQNIEPIFTKIVWERLEEENQEFFKIYYTKLALKDQITLFNDLLHQQAVADLNQENSYGAVVNGSYIPGSNFVFHEGVNHNYVPENIAMKQAETMQQLLNFPAVVQGGFNGGGPFTQSEMQHGPVNMVVGTQNVNGVAVGGPEGYLGNSSIFYQSTHGHGSAMESHRDVSPFASTNAILVPYQLNGTVMDDTSSYHHKLLRQFGQPVSTTDVTYTATGENDRFGDSSRNFGFQKGF